MRQRDDTELVSGLEGLKPSANGPLSVRVDMWYKGYYLGYALVKGVHSERSARVAALRGIATAIYPMNDRDKVQWQVKIAERKDNP